MKKILLLLFCFLLSFYYFKSYALDRQINNSISHFIYLQNKGIENGNFIEKKCSYFNRDKGNYLYSSYRLNNTNKLGLYDNKEKVCIDDSKKDKIISFLEEKIGDNILSKIEDNLKISPVSYIAFLYFQKQLEVSEFIIEEYSELFKNRDFEIAKVLESNYSMEIYNDILEFGKDSNYLTNNKEVTLFFSLNLCYNLSKSKEDLNKCLYIFAKTGEKEFGWSINKNKQNKDFFNSYRDINLSFIDNLSTKNTKSVISSSKSISENSYQNETLNAISKIKSLNDLYIKNFRFKKSELDDISNKVNMLEEDIIYLKKEINRLKDKYKGKTKEDIILKDQKLYNNFNDRFKGLIIEIKKEIKVLNEKNKSFNSYFKEYINEINKIYLSYKNDKTFQNLIKNKMYKNLDNMNKSKSKDEFIKYLEDIESLILGEYNKYQIYIDIK